MLKGVCCAFVFAMASGPMVPPVLAQAVSSLTAEEEAVRRQEAAKTLSARVKQAIAEEKKGRIDQAATLYQAAVGLIPQVGLGTQAVEADKAQAVAGLVKTSLLLAKSAQSKGDYAAADVQLSRALNADSTNPAVVEAKEQNDKMLRQQRGRIPSEETIARTSELQEERIEVGTMVQDGKWLYENGKLDEAQAKLEAALVHEPLNSGASYYLNLVKEAQYAAAARRRSDEARSGMVEVEKAWVPAVKRELLPVPNPMARTNVIYSSPGRQRISHKLRQIHMKEVGFDGVPLSEVLRQLKTEAKNSDPEGKGINFMLIPHTDAASPIPDTAAAFGALTGGAGAGGVGGGAAFGGGAAAFGRGGPGGFAEGGFGQPGIPGDPAGFGAVTTEPESVDINSVIIRIDPPLSDLTLAEVLDAIVAVADQPIRYRVDEYAVVFQPKAAEPQNLITRTFKVDPNTFVQGLESVTALDYNFIGSQGGGGGGGGGGGNTGGGQNGQNGTSSFSLPRVSAAFSSQNGQGGGVGGGQQQGGGGIAGIGGQNGGVGGVGLQFVTTRATTLDLHQLVRLYFTAAGVDLTPPKAIFFNDRSGLLMVRAAAEDLETIQRAIDVLNVAPPQVTIEAKFAEINQNDSKALGFDWYLGNFTFGGDSVGAQGGTAPSFGGPGSASTANPSGIFPGPGAPVLDANGNPTGVYGPGVGTIGQSASDGLLTSGLRSTFGGTFGVSEGSTPTVATITGILTDPQFRVAIKALEQRGGADVLTAPKVTTMSGRQAQIAILDLRTVVTGTDISGNTGGGGNNTGDGGNTGNNAQQDLNYNTSAIPFGPTLDVVPYVSADGFSIQMTIIPTISEFLGYDDPGAFVPQAQVAVGNNVGTPLTGVLPLPRLRTRYVTTSCVVWDGQTIVIGGLIAEDIRKIKDKIPVLGDLPLVGRLFRSESNSSSKKNLYIFVTPTIIDPAGNRVHSDEDLPFTQRSIPDQASR